MSKRRLMFAFCGLMAFAFAVDAGLAAERTLTPRAAGTPQLPALTPVGVPKGAPKLDPARPLNPPPRLPAPLSAPLFTNGTGGAGEAGQAAARLPVAAPALPSPTAAVKPPAAAAPKAEMKAETSAKRPPKAAAKQTDGQGNGKFAEWENGCVLPEDLDNPPPRFAPGTRLLARVDSFQRKAPSCRGHIRGVLLEGETVTALADSGDGWVKVRDRWGAVYWVGGRLLAPAPQR